jgi:SAM-dependent methyltransferase
MDELCRGLTPVVDVGAGPGLDALRLGAIAIDSSRAMAARGRQLGVAYVLADLHRLPLPSESVGALRCDRVIQHTPNPEAAVRELARCIRPGGRLVVADPDQQTLSITVPGADPVLVDRVRQLRRDVGYRNGTYVSGLAALLVALGFVDVTVDAFPLLLRDPDDAFGIATWLDQWGERYGFTRQQATDWARTVRSAGPRGFLYALTYLVVTAMRTSSSSAASP